MSFKLSSLSLLTVIPSRRKEELSGFVCLSFWYGVTVFFFCFVLFCSNIYLVLREREHASRKRERRKGRETGGQKIPSRLSTDSSELHMWGLNSPTVRS